MAGAVLTFLHLAMRPLSASESISPAFRRTKFLLFAPFRKGRTWKLCATAYVSRYGTLFFPFPLIYLIAIPAVRQFGALAVAALLGGCLLATAFFAWIFHLCSRLQFAYLDMVLNRGEFVAPAWRKYGPPSRRWTAFKLMLGTAVTLACALPIAAYVRHILPLLREMGSLPQGQPPPPQFIAVLFAGYGLIALVFGTFYLVSSTLADFVVPSLALENTSLSEAFRRMTLLARAEPGEFALYLLLKIVLGIGIYMGIAIVAEIVVILCTVVLGLIVFAIGFVLHLSGVPTGLLIALAIFLGVIWYLFVFGYLVVLCVGAVFTFLDAYLLYFLGGRYPLLGDLLESSDPPPAAPHPVYPPPGPFTPLEALPPPPTG